MRDVEFLFFDLTEEDSLLIVVTQKYKMFRRSEKKFKAVFKMHFQATQVPNLKAKSLMISLVPVDVGKPTVRLPKAPIVNGTCTWETPVYETVKLVMETKTGQIREKFYYIILSTDSSKSGFLGEVSVDFSDLVEATKPTMLSLPVQTSKSGAVLHVTVEKIQGGSDSRHGEGSEADGEDTDFCSIGRRDTCSIESELNGNQEPNPMKQLERKAEQEPEESNQGQQLWEKIVSLEEERDALKAECEELKSLSVYKNSEASLDSTHEEIKEELHREKQLNKKLNLQLQMSEDSNSEFVLAMRDLSKKVDQKNAEISQLSGKIKDIRSWKVLAAMTRRNEVHNVDEMNMLKKKIKDLCSEIEVHKKEKGEIQMEVDRLMEEFKELETKKLKISAMTLKIEENEKLAQQAVVEADDLRQKNEALEEELLKAKEELQLVRDKYERILKQQSDQSVRNKNSGIAEGRESEMLQRWKLEREDLERQLATVRREAEKIIQENVSIKSQLDQQKTKEENLHLHVKKLRLKNSEVKNHLAELEMENEGLKKEMCKLQSSLCKNKQGQEKAVEQNFGISLAKERSMVTSCMQAVITDKLEQETAALEGGNTTRKNGGLPLLYAEKSGQTVVNGDVSSLLSEVSSLKERNKNMEEELKEMRERYSEISLRFAEVEVERQELVRAVHNLKSGKKN